MPSHIRLHSECAGIEIVFAPTSNAYNLMWKKTAHKNPFQKKETQKGESFVLREREREKKKKTGNKQMNMLDSRT